MKKLIMCVGVLLLSFTTIAVAECVCRCMNGVNQPLCENSFDLPPICPAMLCPLEPISIQPIQEPVLPPLGTTDCNKELVWNPDKEEYEWKTVCR